MTPLYDNVENPVQDDGIRKYLGLNLKVLSLCGMEFNLNNDQPIKKSRFMQGLPIFITNILVINILVLKVNLIAFILRENLEKRLITQICCESFSTSLVICKGLGMATAVENIQTVFDEISVCWSQYKPNRYCRLEIIRIAQQTLNFCKAHFSICIGLAITFSAPAIHHFVNNFIQRGIGKNHTLDYSKRIFLAKYPFEINSDTIYFSVLIEELYLAVVPSMYWYCCDILFVQLTTHIRLQLKILHHDMLALINNEIMEDRLRTNITITIKRHQDLLRVCSIITDIFSPIIFATILFTALNISVNIFEIKMTSAEGNYARTAIHTVLTLLSFFQLLFYCVFAETLTNEASEIAVSIYDCNWTEKDHKLRFYLQMIMMKSQNPFYCSAYGFLPIGHARMASIMTTSFSYLTLLQNIS